MFDKLANIFRIPDLRKRILFTLGLLFVYRVGGHLPTPGIDTAKLESFFTQGSTSGSLLGFVDLFSGGQLRKMTIFALGIMPYITASIILQLLTVVYEPLAKLQKEGELGRKKITQWTRYITVILSSVQSFRIAVVAVEHDSAVNRNDVALLQHPFFRRDAVHNLFIHRRAQHAGIIVVPLERRLGPKFLDLLIGGALQVHGGDTWRYQRSDLVENLADDAAAMPHLLYLRR